MKKYAILAALVLSLTLAGCKSGPFAKKHTEMESAPVETETASKDSFSSQTDSMRGEIDRVKPEKASAKSSKKSDLVYAGVSSEAREIEDHLYGN